MDGLIMFGIMVFVIVAQGALWAWVLIEKRKKVPDVPIMNWRELVEASRRGVVDYYNQMRTPRR